MADDLAPGLVGLEATLVATSAGADEHDAVVTALEHSPKVRSTTWTVGTTA
jgi:hypothetical protein